MNDMKEEVDECLLHMRKGGGGGSMNVNAENPTYPRKTILREIWSSQRGELHMTCVCVCV